MKSIESRIINFGVGLIIGFISILIMVYLYPEALTIYPWYVSIGSVILAGGFSCFLFLNDQDKIEPTRLRNFLRFYLSSVVASFLAPMLLSDLSSYSELIGRLLQVFPLLAVFVSIAKAFTSSTAMVTVLTKKSDD